MKLLQARTWRTFSFLKSFNHFYERYVMDQAKNALKTIFFFVWVPGPVIIIVPLAIVAVVEPDFPPFGGARYLAVVLWLAGGLSLPWCAKDFVVRGRGTPLPTDPPKELVVQGLYRYTRNPMYVGVLLVLFGPFLWFQTVWLLVLFFGMFIVFHGVVILYEEPTLTKKFGDAYKRYLEYVPRWVPRLRRTKWNYYRQKHDALFLIWKVSTTS